ncbi:MAG: hypothetical protein Q8836_02465, partial [Sweet potato little leaf phytoplasma]|nr:hypothetical protein [Sweet potato little leaf phytoplasma]
MSKGYPLLDIDPEIERTFHRRRKEQRQKKKKQQELSAREFLEEASYIQEFPMEPPGVDPQVDPQVRGREQNGG